MFQFGDLKNVHDAFDQVASQFTDCKSQSQSFTAIKGDFGLLTNDGRKSKMLQH